MRKGVFSVFSFIIWKKAETQKPALPKDTDADIVQYSDSSAWGMYPVYLNERVRRFYFSLFLFLSRRFGRKLFVITR